MRHISRHIRFLRVDFPSIGGTKVFGTGRFLFHSTHAIVFIALPSIISVILSLMYRINGASIDYGR